MLEVLIGYVTPTFYFIFLTAKERLYIYISMGRKYKWYYTHNSGLSTRGI
jgi:hypothetical protein